MYLTEDQAVSFLAATQCPVLLFRGDNGWPADSEEEERRRLEAFADRLTVRHVPGSHHLHLDEVRTYLSIPTIVARAVLTPPHTKTHDRPRARWTGSSSPPSHSCSRRPRRQLPLPQRANFEGFEVK